MTLNETKVDLSKIYFHGSSEPKISKLDAPSYEHPFYVTTDLHYAMAFCTKKCSSTGDWGIQKTFTPSSQNFVYVVTLAPNCNVFDFRDKTSAEFKKFYSIIDKDIVDWTLQSEDKFDHSDIYEFINALQFEILKPIEEDTTYSMYYDRRTNASGHALNPHERTMPKELFEKAYAFMHANGLEHAYRDMDIHEIMAPILKKLNSLGFQGILTAEHDNNEENFSSVTTSYAIGIFDVSGLDQLSLIPMKYSWLKKINPTYMQDKTSQNTNEKIKRFIQLYKQIANQSNSVNESSLDSSDIWYFGNNRSRNLRIVKPNWNTPFFLTTSYEYAKDYSDYGVYQIELRNERSLNILDFKKKQKVQQLHWPDIVVKAIQSGKTDLNSIAYDLYILAYGEGKKQPTWIKDSEEWRLAAYYFRDKSLGILDYAASESIWGSEEDHAFLLQMWKDIHDAGFDGFMHVEFGQKVLALFDLRCIGKISAQSISKPLNEKVKNRALKKAFKAKGQAAFPDIKSDDDIMFVSDIPKEKALKLLKKACHDVSNFHPEYMEKAVKWSDDQIFGVFNKHDKRNVLAMASVSYNGDKSGAAYLHEMTGFIKGGYGKKLVEWLLQKFKKVYGQIALEGSGTKDDPYKPNEKLRDKFYATIPGVKIYRVENSIWDCPADFFYYGISDESIKEFLEKTYGSKESLNENIQNSNLNAAIDDVLSAYKQKFGIDLSYMKFKVDSQPVYTNGEPCYEYDEDECAGDWTSLGWIRLNPDMKSVMDRYGVAWHENDDIEEFTKFIIAHELAHEVWNNIADDQFKNDVIEKANDENFSTVYLETVNPDKLAEETFCEYLAHQIVQQRKKIDFPEEEIHDLSRRNHIVTHRVLDDALLFNVGDIVDAPWQIPYKIADKVVVNDIYDSPYVDQLSQEQLEYLQQFDNIAILDLDAQYDPPYTLEQIKANYPAYIKSQQKKSLIGFGRTGS